MRVALLSDKILRIVDFSALCVCTVNPAHFVGCESYSTSYTTMVSPLPAACVLFDAPPLNHPHNTPTIHAIRAWKCGAVHIPLAPLVWSLCDEHDAVELFFFLFDKNVFSNSTQRKDKRNKSGRY